MNFPMHKWSSYFLVSLFFIIAFTIQAQEDVEYIYLTGQKNSEGAYEVPYGSDNLITEKASSIKVFPIYVKGADIKPDEPIGTASVIMLESNSCTLQLTLTSNDLPAENLKSLIFELPVVHKAPYNSIIYLVAAQGLVLRNEGNEAFFGINEAHLYSEYHEYTIMEAMREHIATVAELMRGSMENMDIKGGLFDGQKLFDTMEATTVKNVHQFLTYLYVRPQRYRGSDWMLAEIYATWLISETPMPEVSEGYFSGNLGFWVSDENSMGYPHIQGLFSRVYKNSDAVHIGDLLLSIDGKSLYGKTGKDTQRMLIGEEGTICTVRILGQNRRLSELKVPRMSIEGDDPAVWDILEGEVEEIDLWPVVRSDKWGMIDGNGNEVIDLKYDKVKGFSNGLALFEIDGKAGYLNYEGKEVIPAKWPKAYDFSEGLAAVFPEGNKLKFGGTPAFINDSGQIVIEPKYEIGLMTYGFHNGMCKVIADGKSGFIDTRGELAVPIKYYRGSYTFSDGIVWVKEGEEALYGTIDKKGNWVIPPKYISPMGFHNGKAVVGAEGNSVLIDTKGNIVEKYDFNILVASISPMVSPFQEGVARVKKGDLIGFANIDGKLLSPCKFNHTGWSFSEGLISASDDNEHWYFVDQSGKKVIDSAYEQVSFFSDGVCWVKQGGKWGLIDTEGEMLIKPSISSLPEQFDQGVSLVNMGDIFNEKYILVDKEGTIIWK